MGRRVGVGVSEAGCEIWQVQLDKTRLSQGSSRRAEHRHVIFVAQTGITQRAWFRGGARTRPPGLTYGLRVAPIRSAVVHSLPTGTDSGGRRPRTPTIWKRAGFLSGTYQRHRIPGPGDSPMLISTSPTGRSGREPSSGGHARSV